MQFSFLSPEAISLMSGMPMAEPPPDYWLPDPLLCIYEIRNTVNGKVYVGKTEIGLSVRWQEHFKQARRNKLRFRSALYGAMKKYGSENFSIHLLQAASSLEELNALEIFWIAEKHSHEPSFGYNLTLGGTGGIPSEETRRRISKTKKGVKQTPEAREHIVAAVRGRKRPPVTEETRERLRLSHLGKKQSAETISKRMVRLRGRKHSEETRLKMRAAWTLRKEMFALAA